MGCSEDDRAELRLVTLGHVDIDPDVLTGGGGSLREAIGGRSVDDRTGEVVPSLPQTGWRRVHHSPPVGGEGGRDTFAAPCGDSAARGWAVATVSAPFHGGVRILSADPGPVAVVAGRATRRAALALAWPENLSAAARSVPELRIQLRNTTTQVWSNERDEPAHVRGWLLDPDGHRLEASSWFAHAGAYALPTLQPGQVVTLAVDMAAFDYRSLRPGPHQLHAVLVELDLMSPTGTIQLR